MPPLPWLYEPALGIRHGEVLEQLDAAVAPPVVPGVAHVRVRVRPRPGRQGRQAWPLRPNADRRRKPPVLRRLEPGGRRLKQPLHRQLLLKQGAVPGQQVDEELLDVLWRRAVAARRADRRVELRLCGRNRRVLRGDPCVVAEGVVARHRLRRGHEGGVRAPHGHGGEQPDVDGVVGVFLCALVHRLLQLAPEHDFQRVEVVPNRRLANPSGRRRAEAEAVERREVHRAGAAGQGALCRPRAAATVISARRGRAPVGARVGVMAIRLFFIRTSPATATSHRRRPPPRDVTGGRSATP